MWRTFAGEVRPGSQLKDGLSLETTCLHVSLAPFLPTPRRVRRTGSAGRRGLGIPVRGRFPCFRNPWPVRQAVRRPSSLCALEEGSSLSFPSRVLCRHLQNEGGQPAADGFSRRHPEWGLLPHGGPQKAFVSDGDRIASGGRDTNVHLAGRGPHANSGAHSNFSN